LKCKIIGAKIVAVRKLDVGCGSNHDPEFIGIDIIDGDGVDVVWDLEKHPWPFEDNSFDYIKAFHIIEHINDQVGFFKEVHRVAANNAILHIETPHFSSNNSWADPTHVKHFSVLFTNPIVKGGYLSDTVGCYELVSRRLSFGALFGSIKARLISKLFGYERWERKAFKMPARNIFIDLKVIK